MNAPVRTLGDVRADLGDALERMIAIQISAYPVCWPDSDKREMAVKHLFGRSGSDERVPA